MAAARPLFGRLDARELVSGLDADDRHRPAASPQLPKPPAHTARLVLLPCQAVGDFGRLASGPLGGVAEALELGACLRAFDRRAPGLGRLLGIGPVVAARGPAAPGGAVADGLPAAPGALGGCGRVREGLAGLYANDRLLAVPACLICPGGRGVDVREGRLCVEAYGRSALAPAVFRLSRIGGSRLAPLVDVHVDAPSSSFAGSRPVRLNRAYEISGWIR